jgi:integrase
MDCFETRAEKVRAFMGHELALDVDARRLYELQQHIRGEGFAPATVNGVLALVRAAFTFAGRNGMLSQRPEFPRFLPENNARKGFLAHRDYIAILEELPEWARDPFRFTYHTGWRKMEVLSLRWDEVDLEERLIRLDPARSKTREARVIPWVGELPDVISRRLALRVVGLPVVFHRDGRRLIAPTYGYIFRQACVIAGKPKALIHDCRRTAYRNFLRAGVEKKVAREMVGWRSERMPERYNITDERDFENAAELYRKHMERKANEAAGALLPFEKKGK